MDSRQDRRGSRAQDFDPQVMDLFDQYVHGAIDRRGFLKAAGRFAIGAGGAVALLAALSPRFAAAQKVSPNDARIHAEFLEFDAPKGYGRGRGYLVRPAAAPGPAGLVLVIHENRGLNPHIEDVTRRIALEGYIAFAPDALFPLGGYPGDEDSARALFAQLDQAKTREDFLHAVSFMRGLEGHNGRLGAVGFCYGGGMVNFLATQLPDLDAGAAFYGGAAPLDAVSQIRAELLIVLAENDERVNAGWGAYEKALKDHAVRYRMIQPPNTLHGFNNDTTPRYDEAAAAFAWGEMRDLFHRRLRG